MPNSFFLSFLPNLFEYQGFAPLFLRLALGTIFIVHGWKKLREDKSQLVAWFESMKFRPGIFWVRAVALNETFGGFLIFIGLFAQLAVLSLLVQFLVILFWVRRGQPFIAKPEAPGMSWEFDFLIFFALLALLVTGPGMWAIDLPL